MIGNTNEHKNDNSAEVAAKFINSLSKIFCNKECCADYVRFVLDKPDGMDTDDLNENVASNIELIKKSANKDYDKTKVTKNAADAPQPKKFLDGGKFSGLPDEIKSAYLEKYFEIVDGDSFDYKKSFSDNLKDMLGRYKSYPEGVFLHILKLQLENFEKKPNDHDNRPGIHESLVSKKNLARAIKSFLDSNCLQIDEKGLAILWEYYEYFNGIDEQDKVKQFKVKQFKDALEKIINSDDYTNNTESDLIPNAIITGKLRAYKIDVTFQREYVKILENYSDNIKIAVIESFTSATSPYIEKKKKKKRNEERFDDICYGSGDYKNLSSAVRAKIINKLSNNRNATGIFLGTSIPEFIRMLEKHCCVYMENVSPEILVALLKLFLSSEPSAGENIEKILTTMLQIQSQTNDFKKQADLGTKLLSKLSYDFCAKFKEERDKQTQIRNARLKKSILLA